MARSEVPIKSSIFRIVSVLERLKRHGTHVRNVGSYFVARLFAIALYLLPVPLFIRRHGSASYGTLTLLLLVFTYTQFFDLGVGYAVTQRLGRAVARNSSRLTAIVQTAVPVFGFFAIILSAAIFLCAKQISAFLLGDAGHIEAVRFIAMAMGLLTVDALPVAVLQSYNRVDWINYSRLMIDTTRAAGIFFGAFATHGISVAVGFTIGGVLVKTLVDVVLSVRLLTARSVYRPKLSRRSSAVNLRLGVPMVSSVFFGMLMTSADRIFVGKVFGQEALAYYAIGADLCSRAYFLVWAITGSVYTLYVRRQATRRPTEDLIRVSLISVAIVALSFYLPLVLFARQIIGIWISPAFAIRSAGITRIWAAAAVAYLVSCVYYNHLRGCGKPGVLAASGAIGVALVAVGLWTLPPRFHIAGVAMAMLLSFVGQAIFLWLLSQRARRGATA